MIGVFKNFVSSRLCPQNSYAELHQFMWVKCGVDVLLNAASCGKLWTCAGHVYIFMHRLHISALEDARVVILRKNIFFYP